MKLKDIMKVQMLVFYRLPVIGKGVKQKKISRIKRVIIKNTFKKNLITLIHVLFVENQLQTVLTNQDMKKVKSVRVLKIMSNWID